MDDFGKSWAEHEATKWLYGRILAVIVPALLLWWAFWMFWP